MRVRHIRNSILSTALVLGSVYFVLVTYFPEHANLNSITSITRRPILTVPDAPPKDGSNHTATHRELISTTTKTGSYFPITFGEKSGINPNVIPHPYLEDTWIMVAQYRRPPELGISSPFFSELVCDAVFRDDTLMCSSPPSILPVAVTRSGNKCQDPKNFFSLNIGPHDARVVWGPEAPYLVFGSNSQFTCFGMFAQDFRMLVDWGFAFIEADKYRFATELQRPVKYLPIEKNWFLFWDDNNDMYVHYDLFPQRSFARLEFNGSVGADLAPQANPNDEICLKAYIPKWAVDDDDRVKIHQSTNSLSVTMCDRKKGSRSCRPTNTNTFIMTIFNRKTYVGMFSAVYEPYVALFSRKAPFELYAVSSKPLWVRGRGEMAPRGNPSGLKTAGAEEIERTEMLYTSSISWMSRNQTYHGYQDDVMFINFGLEDEREGGIDVYASDLLQDLVFCGDLFDQAKGHKPSQQ